MGNETVEARRNDVPAQKASIALPPMSSAMIGNATDSDVPSSATTSESAARALKAR